MHRITLHTNANAKRKLRLHVSVNPMQYATRVVRRYPVCSQGLTGLPLLTGEELPVNLLRLLERGVNRTLLRHGRRTRGCDRQTEWRRGALRRLGLD